MSVYISLRHDPALIDALKTHVFMQEYICAHDGLRGIYISAMMILQDSRVKQLVAEYISIYGVNFRRSYPDYSHLHW